MSEDEDKRAHRASEWEAVSQHLFLSEIMRCAWMQNTPIEISHPRADGAGSGYHLVMERGGIVRHIMLKTKSSRSRTSSVKVHVNLSAKPGGCAVWLVVDEATMAFEEFRWFGGPPGEPLPPIARHPIAREDRENSDGVKKSRPQWRIVPQGRFERLMSVGEIVERMFGGSEKLSVLADNPQATLGGDFNPLPSIFDIPSDSGENTAAGKNSDNKASKEKATMKLLITSTSPYARKARIVIAEKSLGEGFPHVETEGANPWENNAGVVAHNPLNKIPVLILSGGEKIIDSRAIAEFLDAQSGEPRLIPAEPQLRAIVKSRESLADGITDAATTVIMAGRILGGAENVPAEWRDWQLEKAKRGVAKFSETIDKRIRQELNLGDIALGCALGFLDFRLPDFTWRRSHPALSDWFDKISERDSFIATVPKA